MSVSHSRMTVQPMRWSCLSIVRSRRRFDSIFWTQYVAFAPFNSAALRRRQLRPCQKSPSQNTATFSRRKTISGQPGRSRAWRRYFRPNAHRAFRRASSGNVFTDRLDRLAAAAASELDFKPRNEGVNRLLPRLTLRYRSYCLNIPFHIPPVLRNTRSAPRDRPCGLGWWS